ncbi:MAG TPA: hypothetical protein VKB88_43500 [Bryobacteraceae bacterium]|nr:hypothetical protein [Bryobacteraceae bacterium]
METALLTKPGNGYFPLGAQRDVTNPVWRPYHVAPGTGWWTEFYPSDNLERSTGPAARIAVRSC